VRRAELPDGVGPFPCPPPSLAQLVPGATASLVIVCVPCAASFWAPWTPPWVPRGPGLVWNPSQAPAAECSRSAVQRGHRGEGHARLREGGRGGGERGPMSPPPAQRCQRRRWPLRGGLWRKKRRRKRRRIGMPQENGALCCLCNVLAGILGCCPGECCGVGQRLCTPEGTKGPTQLGS